MDIKKIINENKEIKELDLSNQNLTDNSPSMKLLEELINLERLNLSGNRLTTISNSLISALKEITFLDITSNPIKDLDVLSKNLGEMKKLVELNVDLSNIQDTWTIINNLPNLRSLNGKPTKEESQIVDLDESEIENINLQEEISNFNQLFGKIGEKLKSVSKQSKQKFCDEFQEILKTEIYKVNQAIETCDPNYIYATRVISLKFKIHSFFLEKYFDYVDSKHLGITSIMKEILNNLKTTSQSSVDNVFKLYPKIVEKFENIKYEEQEAHKALEILDEEIKILQDKLKNATKENEVVFKKYEEEKLKLAERVVALEKEVEDMRNSLDKASQRSIPNANTEPDRKKTEEKDKMVKSFKSQDEMLGSINLNIQLKQKDEEILYLQQKNEQLEKENKMMFSQLVNKAKDVNNTGKYNLQNKQVVNAFRPIDFKQQEEEKKHKDDTLLHNSTVFLTPGGTKVVTKKIIRDIIDEICQNKIQFDKQCTDNKLPKETMEQYMYTYLYHKYGLKNLCTEWANCIINGIKIFSSEDSDICLFGKILRNEVDEEAKNVLQKLKTTITNILKQMIKERFPMKTNTAIAELLKAKTEGSLIEEDWTYVIYFLYEQGDAVLLEKKIRESISRKSPINRSNTFINGKKFSREEIHKNNKAREDEKNMVQFSQFQKILLDFQIRSRDNYLKNFNLIFKKIDIDGDGIINEEEFSYLFEVVSRVLQEELDVSCERLLDTLDPFNNKQISYSSCIDVLSKEMIRNARQISILDKISIEADFTQL